MQPRVRGHHSYGRTHSFKLPDMRLLEPEEAFCRLIFMLERCCTHFYRSGHRTAVYGTATGDVSGKSVRCMSR
jgi:hypothetical protein